jgi:hypothetical protein
VFASDRLHICTVGEDIIRSSSELDRSHGDHSTDIDVFQRIGFAAWEILEVTQDEIEDHLRHLEMVINDESFGIRSSTVNFLENTRDVIRHLLQAQRWRPIDEEAKNGKPHLFLCRWQDQVGYAEVQIVLSWDIDGWFDWDNVKLDDSIPVAYVPLPQSSFEERASATPSDQQNEGDA